MGKLTLFISSQSKLHFKEIIILEIKGVSTVQQVNGEESGLSLYKIVGKLV
jgi:hypothetical protein